MTEKKKKNIISETHRGIGPMTLAEGLNPLVRKLLGDKGIVRIELFADWSKIVGDTLASYTLPQKIVFTKGEKTDGVLHLIVRDGAYAVETAHQKTILIERINTYFGYKAVKDIRLCVDDTFFADPPADLKDDDNHKKTLVTSSQKKYITQLTEGIRNPELKERLQKLGESIAKENN